MFKEILQRRLVRHNDFIISTWSHAARIYNDDDYSDYIILPDRTNFQRFLHRSLLEQINYIYLFIKKQIKKIINEPYLLVLLKNRQNFLPKRIQLAYSNPHLPRKLETIGKLGKTLIGQILV